MKDEDYIAIMNAIDRAKTVADCDAIRKKLAALPKDQDANDLARTLISRQLQVEAVSKTPRPAAKKK